MGSFRHAPGSRPQYRFGGGLAGYNRTFHEALPIGHMFTGEEHVLERSQQGWSHSEPLTRPIERIGTSDEAIFLPCLLLNRKSGTIDFSWAPFHPVGVDDVFHDPILQLPLRGRSNIVCFVADRVTAQDSSVTFLPVGAVETEVRRSCGIASKISSVFPSKKPDKSTISAKTLGTGKFSGRSKI